MKVLSFLSQIVTAGNSISWMGIAKLSMVVKIGDFCHSSYRMTDQANAKFKKRQAGWWKGRQADKQVSKCESDRDVSDWGENRQSDRQAGRQAV